MITGWPSALPSGSEIVRATMSLAPPAAKVTTMRTGFSGHAALAATTQSNVALQTRERRKFKRDSCKRLSGCARACKIRAAGSVARRAAARPSTAAVRGVAPRAHQQRHVVVAGCVGDTEVELHLVDERRVGQRDAALAKVRRHREHQSVATGGHGGRIEQCAAGVAPVGIELERRDDARCTALHALEPGAHAGGRGAVHGVEHVGAEMAHGRQSVYTSAYRSIAPRSQTSLASVAVKATPRDPSIARRRVRLRVIRTGAPPAAPSGRDEAALTATQRI